MSVALSTPVGAGLDSSSGTGIAALTSGPVSAGERLMLCTSAGANHKLVSVTGGGVAWAKVGDHGLNNTAGGLSVWISDPLAADAAAGVAIAGTLDGSNAHKQWLLFKTSGVPGGAADQEKDNSAGSTGSLVTSITTTAGGPTAIDDSLVGMLVFIDSVTPGTVTRDPAMTLLAQQVEGSTGTLVYQERVSTLQETPSGSLAWQNAARGGAVLFSLRGTFVKPSAGVARRDCVLLGVGLNFADDAFADTYAELLTDDDFAYTVPQPSAAPGLAQRNSLGGTLTPGDYYVAYSWSDGTTTTKTQETMISPVAHIALVAPNNVIDVTFPTPPTGHGIQDTIVYVDTAPFVSGGGHQQASVFYTFTPTASLSGYSSSSGASALVDTWPHLGGLGRGFDAARANYAADTTLFPSGYSPVLNSAIVKAYRDGAYASYQNGHPKNPLLGIDNRLTSSSAAAWDGAHAYLVGDHVQYQHVEYQCLVANTGQTPAPGAQNQGTSYWLALGTIAPDLSTSGTYSAGDVVWYSGFFRTAQRSMSSPVPLPTGGADGLGDANWHPRGTYWDTAAKGAYDAAFLTLFAAVTLANDGDNHPLWSPSNPFYYSPAHEQSNAQDTTPNGPGAGTPQQYKPFFDHVKQLMIDHGYHVSVGGPIKIVFAPTWEQVVSDPTLPHPAWVPLNNDGSMVYATGFQNSAYSVSALNPGTQDVTAFDVYSHKTTQTADSVWPYLHTFAVACGRPMAIPEFGCDAGNGESFVVDYLERMDGWVRSFGAGTAPGNVIFLCMTARIAAGGDYRPNATSAILAQWQRMGQELIWGGIDWPPETNGERRAHGAEGELRVAGETGQLVVA